MSHDFARVLRENGVGHVRIHPHTPEQNGFVERVIRTIGEGLHEDELDTFAQAEQALDETIDWYNHRRLHSGIDYLTPASVHDGTADRILAERSVELDAARHRRDDPPDAPAVDSVFPLTELPALLSELDLSQAVRYRPKWELWSNGLEKERRIQLPTGARIDISDPAAWRFPEGTLLLKDFAVRQTDGNLKNVETRLLWRHDAKWPGVVYLWQEYQSDAVLSAGLARGAVDVTNQSGHTFDHRIPSRADCVTCHGASPQFVLGFGELQLNWQADGVEQLLRLQGVDLFAQTVRADPDEIVSDDLEKAWVMGYLTGNCLHCHNGTKQFDLSHNILDDQVVGVVDPTGAILITPGSADESSVYTLLNEELMPPLRVQVLDSVSIARLKAWIDVPFSNHRTQP